MKAGALACGCRKPANLGYQQKSTLGSAKPTQINLLDRITHLDNTQHPRHSANMSLARCL